MNHACTSKLRQITTRGGEEGGGDWGFEPVCRTRHRRCRSGGAASLTAMVRVDSTAQTELRGHDEKYELGGGGTCCPSIRWTYPRDH